MENTVSKRKDFSHKESVALKKARYSWQVKRSTREDLSSMTDVVICDDVSTCQHCNTRGDNSLCGCCSASDTSRLVSDDRTNRNMDCSVPSQRCSRIMDCSTSSHTVCHETEFNEISKVDSSSVPFQIPLTPASSILEGCSLHNLSRTSSPASSSINFSFEGQDVSSDIQKEDGRTSVSSLSNATSLMAQPSSTCNGIDPEIEEESLLISYRQREEELNLYLKRWQNQHIAKSIVDNAINKTLEEMGVSPEPQQLVTNLVETEAINQAIRLQGLIPQSQCTPSNPATVLSDLAHSSSYLLSITNQQRSDNLNNNVDAGSSTSNHELLDHAVSVAIGSKGLSFHEMQK